MSLMKSLLNKYTAYLRQSGFSVGHSFVDSFIKQFDVKLHIDHTIITPSVEAMGMYVIWKDQLYLIKRTGYLKGTTLRPRYDDCEFVMLCEICFHVDKLQFPLETYYPEAHVRMLTTLSQNF